MSSTRAESCGLCMTISLWSVCFALIGIGLKRKKNIIPMHLRLFLLWNLVRLQLFTKYSHLQPLIKRRQLIWNRQTGRGLPFSIIQYIISENVWRCLIMSPTISAQQNRSFLSSFFLTIPKLKFKLPLIRCNAWQGKKIICSSVDFTCVYPSNMFDSHVICAAQNTIIQNDLNYDGGKLTNSGL